MSLSKLFVFGADEEYSWLELSDSCATEQCSTGLLLGGCVGELNSLDTVDALEAKDMRENLVIREDRDDR